MGNVHYRRKQRTDAKLQLKQMFDDADTVLVIHYACESLYDVQGLSPRIASISVRSLVGKQEAIFAIQLVAERLHIPQDQISAQFDVIERVMLDDFNRFIELHPNHKWLHWNMRNVTYGFDAIKHRYAVLGGELHNIPDNEKVNLSPLLAAIYGKGYAQDPKLYNLIERNQLRSNGLLTGTKEADAFDKGEYLRMMHSNSRKVALILEIAELAHTDRLKTNARLGDIYGSSWIGWIEVATDHWSLKLLGILGIIAGIVQIGIWLVERSP